MFSFLCGAALDAFTREVFKEHAISMYLPLQFPGVTGFSDSHIVAMTCFPLKFFLK